MADILKHFDSWGAMVDFASTDSGFGSSHLQVKPEWFGTPSFDAAIDLARNGWIEGTDKASRIADALVDKITSRMSRDEYQYETTGVTFDVARVLENEPECWISESQVVCDAPGKVWQETL